MELSAFQPYLLPALAALLIGAWIAARRLRAGAARRQLPALLAQGAVIVDVRTPAEFKTGSSRGSINIPLAQLEEKAAKLDRSKPVVVCCATGARSASAVTLLKRQGFATVVNAGAWKNTEV